MSKKHRRGITLDSQQTKRDYTKSNHTKNNFKKWLKEARYTELIDMRNILKEKIMQLNSTRAREGRIYPLNPSQAKIENMRITKYKYNLICNKLNLGGLKNG